MMYKDFEDEVTRVVKANNGIVSPKAAWRDLYFATGRGETMTNKDILETLADYDGAFAIAMEKRNAID